MVRRYDNKAARLPSVVKPGDLGLMFSDSSAKEFCIEIDRVKVQSAIVYEPVLHHHGDHQCLESIRDLQACAAWHLMLYFLLHMCM